MYHEAGKARPCADGRWPDYDADLDLGFFWAAWFARGQPCQWWPRRRGGGSAGGGARLLGPVVLGALGSPWHTRGAGGVAVVDQLRDQRSQRRRYWPPFAPWVHSEELRWAGCGPGDPTWPLGRFVRWPLTPTGTGAGSSAAPPYPRTGGCRLGAAAARVLGSSAWPAAPSWQFTYPGMGMGRYALRVTRYAPSFGKASSDRTSPQPSFSKPFLHLLARSCVLT
jgi:hypothetical protein